MLKFVLRLFVVLAVGFVISNEIVDRSANYLFEPVSDAYTRESVRGQIHSLVQELSRIEPASRRLTSTTSSRRTTACDCGS